MSETTVDPELADRLTRLTGQDAACCAGDLKEDARSLRADEGFERGLSQAKALADGNRLTALGLLVERGQLCACEIQAALGVTHATVSHHMDRLRTAGLVEAERRGTWVHYEATDVARDLLARWGL